MMSAPQRNVGSESPFWRWQAFRLVYVLCVIFVLPAVLIGSFALYLAIYEPEQFVKSVRSQPQVAVDPLESPSSFTREAALQKLIADPADRSRRDVVPKIKQLLRDPNPKIQELAIAALGKVGQGEDVEALLELAKDRFSIFIRPQICQALGEIDGDESLEALVEILGMGTTERDQAVAALSRRRAAAETTLLRRAAEVDAAQQVAICFALGKLGSEQAKPYLEGAATSDDLALAAAAKQALLNLRQGALR